MKFLRGFGEMVELGKRKRSDLSSKLRFGFRNWDKRESEKWKKFLFWEGVKRDWNLSIDIFGKLGLDET